MKPSYEDLEQKIVELDKTVAILQRMNENTAKMAVDGFKSDLASAMKSIVEDAQIPEARTDAEIAYALLEDMLGILRWKGIFPA